ELQHSAMLTYDTRDSLVIPHRGARYIVYAGFVSRALGSSVSYSFFGAEARHYWALGPDVTLAWHAALRYMPSAGNAPFWALSSLGGDRSVIDEREPLRGYGADRFIDRNLFATGLELRMSVANFNAFGTRVSVEVAPFLDAGKVFAALGASTSSCAGSALTPCPIECTRRCSWYSRRNPWSSGGVGTSVSTSARMQSRRSTASFAVTSVGTSPASAFASRCPRMAPASLGQ